MLFLGLDLGSSSAKASVIDAESGDVVAAAHYPEAEMPIDSEFEKWAEQDPDIWWSCCIQASRKAFMAAGINSKNIAGVGIAYQMHGLVMVDENNELIRPAIIWCDSRAQKQGDCLAEAVGNNYCSDNLLNRPANFTSSKLLWIKENEPENFARCKKILLPGDYIAMRLSGDVTTTASGLSEAILWDFKEKSISTPMLEALGIDASLMPDLVPSIGLQGRVNREAASAMGLRVNTPLCYRAGDQPNNAFSLNVAKAGEVAATAGTSGVIYGIKNLETKHGASESAADSGNRVNTFLHVNADNDHSEAGILLCVSGAGRAYSWLRSILNTTQSAPSYDQMNAMAASVGIGSEGLQFYPFGNGAERLLENKPYAAQLQNLDFNRHDLSHIVRATQEGVAYSFAMGFEVFTQLATKAKTIRVGRNNLFLSDSFSQVFCGLTDCPLEFYDTDGATGAARGAALGFGFYETHQQAFISLKPLSRLEPDRRRQAEYEDAFAQWKLGFPTLISEPDSVSSLTNAPAS